MAGRLHLRMVPFLAALWFSTVLPGTALGHALPGAAWAFGGVENLIKSAPGTPVPATFTFRAAANGSWTARAGAIARDTIGLAVRRRLWSPWGVALAAALTAAGYALDDASETVYAGDTGPSVDPSITPDRVAGWHDTGWRDQCGSFSYSYSASCAIGDYALNECRALGRLCTHGAERLWRQPSGNWVHEAPVLWWGGTGDPDCGAWVWTGTECVEQTGPVPVSDGELGDWAVDNLSDRELADLFYDPSTGAPYPLPEEEPIHTQLEADTLAQQDGDPNTTPAESVDVKSAEQVADEKAREERMNLTGVPTFDDSVETPQKADLGGMLTAKADSFAAWWQGRVGLNASAGQCRISIPFAIGGRAGNGELDFCRFSGELAAVGAVLLGLSYLAAGLLLIKL